MLVQMCRSEIGTRRWENYGSCQRVIKRYQRLKWHTGVARNCKIAENVEEKKLTLPIMAKVYYRRSDAIAGLSFEEAWKGVVTQRRRGTANRSREVAMYRGRIFYRC